jgi:uncharacterized protein (TIGR00661 family)
LNILFAIQGTGNGHLSRARDIYPELLKYGNTNVLISGIQADVALPYPVRHKHYGMSFIFGKKGGVDIMETFRRLRLRKLVQDIRNFPIDNYDLIINDFEPVTAWACKLKGKPCIGLSHQSAVLHPNAPKPEEGDALGKLVLQHYAPVTAAYGFHFKAFGPNIYTPVIRQEIRALQPVNNGHYTVYLPAYSDETIVKHLSAFKGVEWQVFSKHNKQPLRAGGVAVQPINNESFVASMASSAGVLVGGGFEGPAEAMYLGKKVLVIPMHAQYEQQCNAAGAAMMGATMIPELAETHHPVIANWLQNGQPIHVDYPDNTAQIIATLMREHGV